MSKIKFKDLKIGTEYKVNHSRKGKFQVKITNVSDEWATGIITNGKAGAMLKYNELFEGDEIDIRDILATFESINP